MLTAKDIMTTEVVTIKESAWVAEARTMGRTGITQGLMSVSSPAA